MKYNLDIQYFKDEEETVEVVDGAEYIEYQFGKDYEKAFLAI